MEQKHIFRLLNEASELVRNKASLPPSEREKIFERLETIFEELKSSIPSLEVGSRSSELVLGLVDTLLTGTLNHRPEHLPQLFPFFAALCSDKNHYLGSAPVPIEWDLLLPKK